MPASITVGILAGAKVGKAMRCCSHPVKTAVFAMAGVICALLAAGAGRSVRSQTAVGAQPSAGAYDGASCIVAPRPDSLWSLAQCCTKNLKSDTGCLSYDAADKYISSKTIAGSNPQPI